MVPLIELRGCVSLGTLLARVERLWGTYEWVEHRAEWATHHLVLRVDADIDDLPGQYLLITTNPNGVVREVLSVSRYRRRARRTLTSALGRRDQSF